MYEKLLTSFKTYRTRDSNPGRLFLPSSNEIRATNRVRKETKTENIQNANISVVKMLDEIEN